MTKRGLVIFVGATGCGKSTSLAAMIGYRNENSHATSSPSRTRSSSCTAQELHDHAARGRRGHRLLGSRAQEHPAAGPDVILIGEIREREVMEHAIAFAETGHLALGTLHANNSNQAMDRIINFFPRSGVSSC